MTTLRGAVNGLLASLGLLLALSNPLLAQSAQILPNAKTQFLNANGQPLAGGSVYSTCLTQRHLRPCGPMPSRLPE